MLDFGCDRMWMLLAHPMEGNPRAATKLGPGRIGLTMSTDRRNAKGTGDPARTKSGGIQAAEDSLVHVALFGSS